MLTLINPVIYTTQPEPYCAGNFVLIVLLKFRLYSILKMFKFEKKNIKRLYRRRQPIEVTFFKLTAAQVLVCDSNGLLFAIGFQCQARLTYCN